MIFLLQHYMCVLQRSWGKCVNDDSFFLHNILWCRQQAGHNKILLYTDWCKMSPYVESYKHVENLWVIRSVPYVQKRRNARTLIMNPIIFSRMNIGYGKNWRNARDFIIDLIIFSRTDIAYVQKRRNTQDFLINYIISSYTNLV